MNRHDSTQRRGNAGLSRALARNLVLIVIAVATAGPFLWALSTSLKPTRQILEAPPSLIPADPTIVQYERIVRDGVVSAFAVSTFVTVTTIVVTLVLGVLAAYALSRFEIPLKRSILLLFVAALSMPIASVLVPIQSIAGRLGWLDSLVLLIVVYVSISLPYAVWLLKTHFDSAPRELEQAAAIDGYGRLATMRKVLLPGAMPAILVAAIFTFLAAWNDYIVAAVLLRSPATQTIQVGLMFYLGTFGREWGPLMAGVVIAIVPPLLVFFIFRKKLIVGVADGAVKG